MIPTDLQEAVHIMRELVSSLGSEGSVWFLGSKQWCAACEHQHTYQLFDEDEPKRGATWERCDLGSVGCTPHTLHSDPLVPVRIFLQRLDDKASSGAQEDL